MSGVVLYTRAGCHLCDEARELIDEILARAEVTIEVLEVDIESDERLHLRYLERIPVIEVDGAIVSELAPDPLALQTALLHTSPR